ncbi:MAG: pimB 2 [Pedosphaera sp.]|nr:pimB 2 [Pedosphaera sp.]
MKPGSAIRKVAFLGDYLPRKCGIATFTTDLRCSVAAEFPAMQCLVVPVNDLAGSHLLAPLGELRYVTALEIPPMEAPKTALRVTIVPEIKGKQ